MQFTPEVYAKGKGSPGSTHYIQRCGAVRTNTSWLMRVEMGQTWEYFGVLSDACVFLAEMFGDTEYKLMVNGRQGDSDTLCTVRVFARRPGGGEEKLTTINWYRKCHRVEVTHLYGNILTRLKAALAEYDAGYAPGAHWKNRCPKSLEQEGLAGAVAAARKAKAGAVHLGGALQERRW